MQTRNRVSLRGTGTSLGAVRTAMRWCCTVSKLSTTSSFGMHRRTLKGVSDSGQSGEYWAWCDREDRCRIREAVRLVDPASPLADRFGIDLVRLARDHHRVAAAHLRRLLLLAAAG